ncbi:MAG TPA: tetratricopeptide repeat protein, partial [Planctomycetota bacterium]|nr:tetratricopeptide repeat protein [Planctomycetota bacterium]
MDERIRDLERRAAADPSDDEARLALALQLVRSGNVEGASEKVDPASAAGYRLLVERAAREPSLLPLLDRAPEWRSSGGDAGCTRWSKAAPVTTPRTLWRRRIEGVHAALGVAVDRGSAYVVTL